jgi:hypothetical protein
MAAIDFFFQHSNHKWLMHGMYSRLTCCHNPAHKTGFNTGIRQQALISIYKLREVCRLKN